MLNQDLKVNIISYLHINLIFQKIPLICKELSMLIRTNNKFWTIYSNLINEEFQKSLNK